MARGLGGGLLSIGTSASLTNVTISGNRTGDGGNGGAGAQSNSLGGGAGGWGGYGGGISAYGPGKAGLQLSFVTISGNGVGAAGVKAAPTATFPGFHGGPGAGGGIATGPAYGSGGGVTLANSIVAGNGGANCNQFAPEGVLDGGHDVTFGDSTCPGTVANPLLGALANNGGLTETMLPGTGSAAIGIVPSASCSPYVDQRGDSRPGSGKSACDAGAVETGAGPNRAVAPAAAVDRAAAVAPVVANQAAARDVRRRIVLRDRVERRRLTDRWLRLQVASRTGRRQGEGRRGEGERDVGLGARLLRSGRRP